MGVSDILPYVFNLLQLAYIDGAFFPPKACQNSLVSIIIMLPEFQCDLIYIVNIPLTSF